MSDPVSETVPPTAASTEPTLTEAIRQKLATAPTPLLLKDLARGLTRPKKVNPAEFTASLPMYLADDLREGRVHRYASGKGGAERFWAGDEKAVLQKAVFDVASAPLSVADLVKKAASTKADKAFVESLVRDLIAEERLFEYPPKAKDGPPRFGTEKPAPPPPPPPPLSETLRDKLTRAEAPLTLKEIAAGLTRPKGMNAADFLGSLPEHLAADLQAGRLFRYASGPKGTERYWHRDEHHLIREAALTAAATPHAVAELAAKALEGTKADKGFAENIVRELIGEDKLYEHPPKKKGKPPLVATTKPAPPPPPPHPLAVGKAKKDFDKLVGSVRNLLESVPAVTVAELLSRLSDELATAAGEVDSIRLTPGAAEALGAGPEHGAPTDTATVEERILQLVQGVPAMLTSDLRLRMPEEHRGKIFDAAVIRLAEAARVVINADADPRRFSDEERARFVTDGEGRAYTTIAKRS